MSPSPASPSHSCPCAPADDEAPRPAGGAAFQLSRGRQRQPLLVGGQGEAWRTACNAWQLGPRMQPTTCQHSAAIWLRLRPCLVPWLCGGRASVQRARTWAGAPCRVHWQIPGMELHTVNVVEVTAPVIQMAFLDTAVRPLLKNTYSGEHAGGVAGRTWQASAATRQTSAACCSWAAHAIKSNNAPPASAGWGLPFCFTAVAGFPHGRLAAIDSVCMIHPARDPPGGPLAYASAPL